MTATENSAVRCYNCTEFSFIEEVPEMTLLEHARIWIAKRLLGGLGLIYNITFRGDIHIKDIGRGEVSNCTFLRKEVK